jgi:hypothetical protein
MARGSVEKPILGELGRKKGEMLQALRQSRGIVRAACELVGITRYQHDDWMRDDPDYRSCYQSIREDRTDFVEEQMIKLIEGAEYEVMTEAGIQTLRDAPCKSTIKFYLESQAKGRGYVTRQEITGADGGAVTIVLSDV